MKNRKNLIIIFTILVIAVACIIYNFMDYSDKVILYINDEKITLSKNDKVDELNLSSLNSSTSSYVKINSIVKTNIRINGKKIYNYKKIDLGKISISKENKLKIEIKYDKDDEYKTYYINTLPDNFLEYEVEVAENNAYTDGNYYMTTYTSDDSTSYVFRTDEIGEINYYKKCEGFCSQFRKETSSDGKDRYVYTAQDMEDSKEIDMNNIYGKMVVMDESYKVIDEVQYIENAKSNNDKTYTIFEYIDDGHYLITSSSREKTSKIEGIKELTLIENNIQEIKDGKVIFEWRSSEHKELYDYIEDVKSLSLEEANDYIHINKVIVDPEDNNLIASFRNISTILKIDRNTGKIIWSLGGKQDDFGLTKHQKFGYQHSLSFTSDHSLMIYDNGDNRPALGIKNESRVIKVKLNEANKKIVKYNDYKLNGVYSMAMGSVQVIDEENEIFLVTYGTGIFSKGPVALIDFKNHKTLFSFNILSNKMMFSSQKTN